MTLHRGIALLTHDRPRLLFRGPELDAGAALRAAIARLRQAMCGLFHHEYYVHSSANRIFLQCVTCGHETPGWRIDVKTRQNRITRARTGLPIEHCGKSDVAALSDTTRGSSRSRARTVDVPASFACSDHA